MKTFGTWILTLGVISLISGPTLAQRPGRAGTGMVPIFLLQNERVQQELKLDDEQVKRATAAADELGQRMREAVTHIPAEERQEKLPQLLQELGDKANSELKAILREEQLKRFEQIAFQFRGPDALTDPEVQETLKLSDEQKQDLEQIQRDYFGQMRTAFQENQGDREAIGKKIGELRQQTLDKALGVLNDDQKAQWKELTGEPFDISALMQGPRGG